jgi:hypothetical protein
MFLGVNIAKNRYFPASFNKIIPYRNKKNIFSAGLDADSTSHMQAAENMTSTSGVIFFFFLTF